MSVASCKTTKDISDVSLSMDKICGSLGCGNDAVGKVYRNGAMVWTCANCASSGELIESELP